MRETLEQFLLDDMANVRRICSVGMSLRQRIGKPVSYTLYEVQWESDRYQVVSQAARGLVEADLNCLFSNPFFIDTVKADGSPATWEYLDKDGIHVRLRTDYLPGEDERQRERLERRAEIMSRKEVEKLQVDKASAYL